MTQVLDYSLARPDPAAIAAAGYVGVVRYLAPAIDAPKVITAAEYSALRAAGLQVVLNWEWYGNRAREGAAAGTADAQAALQQADALGYTGAIYFSVDYDAPPEDQPNINAYFEACAGVIGKARLGCYGGYWPLARLFDAGLITYGWQTFAWSGSNRESRAHLYQNGATIAGADINDVLKQNWTGVNMLPDGWTDDTNNRLLTAPNGVAVKDDFRLLILNEPFWRRENVPAGPDYAADPLTISDTSIGKGQRQDFEYCSLGWTAQIAHAFYLGTTKEIAALKAQPAPTPAPVDFAPVLAELQDAVKRLEALPTSAPVPTPVSGGAAPVSAPVEVPAPPPQVAAEPAQVSVPPGWKAYVVETGDSLQTIAGKLGLGNVHGDLFQPNMDTIETAARAAGHPGSNSGEVLIPGTVLLYR